MVDGKPRQHFTRWRTTSFGYGRFRAPVSEGEVHAVKESSRVEIRRPGLVEWFVNTSHGLEHGYTLPDRPPGEGHGAPLRVTLALDGDLLAEVSVDGQHVVMRDKGGAEALRYDKLKVWDAAGKMLESRMLAEGMDVSIEVEDADAVYPVTIDPIFSQQAYLKASNTGSGDVFGFSLDVDGDTAVVGAYLEDSNTVGVNGAGNNNLATNAGAVYVFVRNAQGEWTQQAYLKASNTAAGDFFGIGVAIDGDNVVVGAMGEASNATTVGGDQTDNSASAAGAAYVFVRDEESAWSQQAYLKASNAGAGDGFGQKVDISGNAIVVSARTEDSSASGVNGDQVNNSAADSGAAYVFVRNEVAVWTQQAYLKASNTGTEDWFGTSAAIDGDTIVVGAIREDSITTGVNGSPVDTNQNFDSGAAYVFLRDSQGIWLQQAYLKSSNTGGGDGFGDAVAIEGNTVVIGAAREDSDAVGINGSQSSNGALNSGAAYVFTRDGVTWTQQAYLKASNSAAHDFFGFSVAVGDRTIIVGATGEDSSATGIDGDQFDNSALSSGAVYVFGREGATWLQQAYLKASNTEAGDDFGQCVAIAGETILVSARQEDSAATGVDGNEGSNAANASGAAFVFLGVLPRSFTILGNNLAIPNGAAIPSLDNNTNFGSAAISVGSKGRSFTIYNDGEAEILLTGAPNAVIVNGSAAFAVTGQPLSPIGPGDSATFTVTFSPNLAGAHSATISIASNVPGQNPHTFAISGFASQPATAIFGDGLLISDGANTPNFDDHTAFGSASWLGGSVSRTFTVTSEGDGDLVLSGSPDAAAVSGSSAFTITRQPGSPVAPGGETAFNVTFAPGSPGAHSATVSIASNAVGQNPYTFDISGTGVQPTLAVLGNGILIPHAASGPNSGDKTDFGAISVGGGSALGSFTVRNDGEGDLVITGDLTIAGSNAFRILTQPGETIAPGGETVFTIVFDPGSPGSHLATVSIPSDDPENGVYSFAIEGFATQPLISVRLGAKIFPNGRGVITFQSVKVRKRGRALAASLLNTGTEDLTGLAVSLAGSHRRDFLLTPPLLRTLPPDGLTSVKTTFRPSAKSVRKATLEVRSNAANASVFRIKVQGRGK